MVKTYTVRKLIKLLNVKNYLDKRLFISSDEEGNSFGTIHVQSMSLDGDCIIIYPHQERLDYDELGIKEDGGEELDS
jgi:hypothetical protein